MTRNPTDQEIAELNEYFKKHHPALWLVINHHRTHKNQRMTFHHYEYQRGIYLDTNPWKCVIKSTQNGLSEYLCVEGFAKGLQGRSVFHVMPTGALKDRYVKNRVDRSVQFTPFYQNIFIEEEKKKVYGRFSESMSLKHFGEGTIAYVGSNSVASFTEFPADDVIIDEFDQCDQKNILMADERLSNSDDPRRIYVSNPTVEGFGIDNIFDESDKRFWFIKCNHCGHWFEMDWFETVVLQIDENDFQVRDPDWEPGGNDARVFCPKCAKPNNRYKPGEWVQTYPSIIQKSGYQISKVFSSKTRLDKLLDNFDKALVNPDKMQRFWNADLGKAFTGEGSKITEADLKNATGEHFMRTDIKGYKIMGVDVGSLCNYVTGTVQYDGSIPIGEIGVLPTTASAIASKAKELGIGIIVIDARPEAFLVRTLKEKFKRTISCYYVDEAKAEFVDRNRNIRIDRTSSLDEVREALVTGKFILPKDWPSVSDFQSQMLAATRIFDPEAKGGEGAYRWTEGSKADHYHHAFNYMNIAHRIIKLLSR